MDITSNTLHEYVLHGLHHRILYMNMYSTDTNIEYTTYEYVFHGLHHASNTLHEYVLYGHSFLSIFLTNGFPNE